MNQIEAAKLLGVTERTLRNWEKEVPPIPVNQITDTRVEYDAPMIVKWYVDFKLSQYAKANVGSDKKAAETREAFAKAELREIELAKEKGELVPVDEVAEIWLKHVLVVRNTILNFPHQIAISIEDGLSYQEKKQKVQNMVDELLRNLATTTNLHEITER